MKKFSAIAKIHPDKYVKYRTNHPDNLVKFLHTKFGNVLWVNFFNKATRQQVGNWTKNRGLNMYL
jgi:hypothetical protein